MKTTVGNLKAMVAQVIAETRGHLNPQEVLTTYEDLYINSVRNNRAGDHAMGPAGVVPLETLASMLGASPEQLAAVMHKAGLIVDRDGNVVERGNTPPPMKAVKG